MAIFVAKYGLFHHFFKNISPYLSPFKFVVALHYILINCLGAESSHVLWLLGLFGLTGLGTHQHFQMVDAVPEDTKTTFEEPGGRVGPVDSMGQKLRLPK